MRSSSKRLPWRDTTESNWLKIGFTSYSFSAYFPAIEKKRGVSLPTCWRMTQSRCNVLLKVIDKSKCNFLEARVITVSEVPGQTLRLPAVTSLVLEHVEFK